MCFFTQKNGEHLKTHGATSDQWAKIAGKRVVLLQSLQSCRWFWRKFSRGCWQGQTWEVQSPPLSCSPVEDTKAHQSTNMFEPRTKFAFSIPVYSCVIFTTKQTSLGNLTSHWPSWVAWSSNHWKDLVLFSSLEIPKGPVSSLFTQTCSFSTKSSGSNLGEW